jgi:hypothetical protein
VIGKRKRALAREQRKLERSNTRPPKRTRRSSIFLIERLSETYSENLKKTAINRAFSCCPRAKALPQQSLSQSCPTVQ